MEKGLVSAIITTYKRESTVVARAVNSVLNQTYRNIEIIIVDDSGEDYIMHPSIIDTVCHISDKIKYIRHEKNMGACAARNTGIKASNGEFIAGLDDDDEWEPDKIEKMIKLFSNEEVGIVYCNPVVICGENVYKFRDKLIYRGSVFERVLDNNFIGSVSFPVIRRTAFDKVGMYDVLMQSSQDHEMWLRICKEYKVDFVDEPLVKYHEQQFERITTNPKKQIAGRERLLMLYKDDYKKYRKAYSRRLIELSEYYIFCDRRKAITIIIKSFVNNPIKIKRALKALYHVFRAAYQEHRN